MKMHVYNVYVDDDDYVYKAVVAAESEEAAKDRINGDGEIIAVKEVPFQGFDLSRLAITLRKSGCSQMEIYIILDVVAQVGLERF